MEVATTDLFSEREEIVLFEGSRLPGSGLQHFLGQIGSLFDTFGSILGASRDFAGLSGYQVDDFSTFEVFGVLFVFENVNVAQKESANNIN
jgi:hypothetical protein